MKIIIHHAEIGIKGKNRGFFERKLITGVKNSLDKNDIKIKELNRKETRIYCQVECENKDKVINALKKVFGIGYFAFFEETTNEKKEIIKTALKSLKNFDKEKSLAIFAKRSDKTLPYTSLEIRMAVGEEAIKKGFKIDLRNPEQKLFIELTSKKAIIYDEKIQGLKGLPVGCSGKVLCLFSGGIDSSVASWMMMKRGCKVDFLHVHSSRNNKDVMNTKIPKLIKILDEYQNNSKLFLVPYHNYQLITLDKIKEKNDVIVFRNFILRLAHRLALDKGYLGLVTGDSVGQVASQTLENLNAASHNLNALLLRPLIALDKQEIINLSKEIGTYEESIKEYKDCCSIISRKPSTRVKIHNLKKDLNNFDMNKIIEESYKDMETFTSF